ncbi:MAG: vancomycin high temperature exclusion protein [Succinivibrionaceae bacterium]
MANFYRASFSNEFGGFIKSVTYIVTIIFLICCILLGIALTDISRMSIYTYDSVEKVPYNKTGLVLGTSKYLVKGGLNTYFVNRINATVELYNSHKIDYIVVSGDNALPSYNEPRIMRKELIKRGIPSKRIYLDYAGFRTLDSVVRINKIFKQKNITIISQSFQNERAIYLARHHDIQAIGYNANGIDDSFFISILREFFARIVCIFDVYIFESMPKFLGDTIEIGSETTDPKQAQFHQSNPPFDKDNKNYNPQKIQSHNNGEINIEDLDFVTNPQK